MNTKKAILAGLITLLVVSLGAMNSSYAANTAPVAVEGDTLEYDATSGIVKAKGNVNIKQADTMLFGAVAEYNMNTKEAYITGNVKAVQNETTMIASEIKSYDNNHLVATGDVLLTKGQDKLQGAQVDYYTDKEYALVTGGAQLDTQDAVMMADSIEAFTASDRATGHNNVHFVSQTRKVDATADTADYYGPKNGKSKVVLTGNAHAVQEGNVLTGSLLTIYLDEKAVDAQGRAKLIIQPQ